jgi:hypothetical protein
MRLFFLMLFLISPMAQSDSYHFVCHEKLPNGKEALKPGAMLIPRGKDLLDKKAGAVFSMTNGPLKMFNSQKVNLNLLRSNSTQVVLRSLRGETKGRQGVDFVLSGKELKRELAISSNGKTIKRYRCYGESSI